MGGPLLGKRVAGGDMLFLGVHIRLGGPYKHRRLGVHIRLGLIKPILTTPALGGICSA
jgi:hypothetical protein